MAIMYFDGFDQYATIPEPTAAIPCQSSRGLTSNTTVPTDPSILTLTAHSLYRKILGDDRVWRTPVSSTSGTGADLFSFNTTGVDPYISPAANSHYLMLLDALAPLTTNKKLVVGFKNKLACNLQQNSFNRSHLLAAFSSSSSFSSLTETFGLILAGRDIYISNISSAANGSIINVNSQSIDIGPLLVSGSPYVGPSNFVFGTASDTGSPLVPPINELPANTVEIEITVEGKITCWINNQYVGSTQFINPAAVANIRFIRLGGLTQMKPSVTSNYIGFNGITDLYLLNGLGTRNTTRLGKVKVVSRSPSTDVAVQFQRPSTATSNAQIAGQIPPTFSSALTGIKEGDTDMYGSPAFNFTNEAIVATSVTTTGYKTDPSGNDIAPVINVSGTKYVGSTNIVPISATQMKTKQSIYEVNPKTGLPFTKTDLDATTFGVTVVAPVVVVEE